MYTLRIITDSRDNENVPFQQVIENHELGSSYHKYERGKTEQFNAVLSKIYPEEGLEKVRAIICGKNESVFFLLKNNSLENHAYYIMTDNGTTFERL